MKERFAAIFIGVIMIMSVAGFALINVSTRGSLTKKDIPEISPVMKRPLTPEEKVTVLRSGRVIIENLYPANCTDCFDKNVLLENFVNQYRDYIVMEEVVANQTSLKIIGKGGQIKPIENVTDETLMDLFCEMAMLQPKECLLRGI
jgi:hypothetical protein